MPFKFNPTTGALDLVNSGSVTFVTASAPLASTGGATPNLSITQSSGSTDGYLSSTDWNTFNNKQPAGSYITALTGDVTATGPGSVASTVAKIQGTTVSGTTGTTNVVFSDSPALTGVPTAPTASIGTSTTQIATTAFVLSQGFQGATGSMPFAHQSSTSVVTSATTTYVTAITTTITVTATSAPVYANATATLTTTTAASVAKYRVTINGVAGQEQLLSLTATATNYTAAVEYISASLGPGTYTVLFQIARNSGTGTVNFFEGTLDAIALQGTESNGISQLTGDVTAGPGSGSQVATIANLAVTNAKIANATIDLTTKVTGILPLANGGTNANLTASNGAIPYSTASAIALLAPGSANQLLRSAGAAAPTWTTATYPNTTTINQILYSNAANAVVGLATANTGALVTSSTGVPSITSGTTANRLLRTNGTTVSFAQVAAATDISGTLAVVNGGTGLTSMFASGRVPFSNGTTFAADALLTYNTATNQFTVGNGAGTGKISSVVLTTDPSPNLIAGNFYSRTTGNVAVEIQNEGTLGTLDMTNSGGTTLGANIFAEASRGTLVARTQSQSGDTLFSLTAHGYGVAAYSTGIGATLGVVTSETVTNATNGAEWFFSTTPNGATTPIERLRIKQSGELTLVNSHLKSTQTSAPTVVADANAGTGASASLTNATDIAGQVTIITGTIGLSTGSYATITFNKAYAVAPIVVLTPASSTLSTSVYVTSTTTTFSVNFAVAGGITSTYILNYFVIETQ